MYQVMYNNNKLLSFKEDVYFYIKYTIYFILKIKKGIRA